MPLTEQEPTPPGLSMTNQGDSSSWELFVRARELRAWLGDLLSPLFKEDEPSGQQAYSVSRPENKCWLHPELTAELRQYIPREGMSLARIAERLDHFFLTSAKDDSALSFEDRFPHDRFHFVSAITREFTNGKRVVIVTFSRVDREDESFCFRFDAVSQRWNFSCPPPRSNYDDGGDHDWY